MPVEGNWERVGTPLSGRDRRLLATLAVVAVAAIIGGVVYAVTRPARPSNAGCVVVTLASTMGGATLRNCGPAAKTFCRTQGTVVRGAAAQCRRLGDPVGPTQRGP